MKIYCQRDYPNVKLGFSNTYTIAQAGCVLTSMAMFAEIDPVTANNRVKAQKGFNGASMIWSVAAFALGLKYSGMGDVPRYPCLGITDHYKSSGYPTHYFIVLDPQTIVDPLDGKVKPFSTYRIIGYQYVQPISLLTMEQLQRLQRLEDFVSRTIAGKKNEYLLPDGGVIQVFEYSDYSDYKDIMKNEDKNLIRKSQDFIDRIKLV